MTSALLLIDLQNDYFPGGRMELEGADSAVTNAAKLLHQARKRGMTIVHIQHIALQPGATFFLPNTSGANLHRSVEPLADESVLIKHYPNSFRDTGLDELLRSKGITRLVVAGMMSHMCVDAAARAAFDLGYKVELVKDACATRKLGFEGTEIPASHVHGAFMAALGAVYATLVTTADAVAEM